MTEAFGLHYPVIFLTFAKAFGLLCLVFFLADQFFGEEEEFDE